jgi:hypothetical protein
MNATGPSLCALSVAQDVFAQDHLALRARLGFLDGVQAQGQSPCFNPQGGLELFGGNDGEVVRRIQSGGAVALDCTDGGVQVFDGFVGRRQSERQVLDVVGQPFVALRIVTESGVHRGDHRNGGQGMIGEQPNLHPVR